MRARPGFRRISARTMARTPSAPGKRRGPRGRRDVTRWRCAPRMKKATRNPMNRSGIPGDTSGTRSSGRKLLWETRAKGRPVMKNRVRAIFLVTCSLVMAAAAVYADLKKGYYRPAELGSVRQAAPIELSPDSTYQVSAYLVLGTDLVPGDGS